MTYRFRLDYQLRLKTGLAIQSGSGGGRFHQSLMRDRDGLLIPASTQKGRLKFYCERIAALLHSEGKTALAELDDLIEQLFGSDRNRQESLQRRRYLLYFENAYLNKAFTDGEKQQGAPFMPAEARARILINRKTGSIEGQHLAFYQASARDLIFDAHIEGLLADEEPGRDPALGLLLTALGMFERLGSNQSRGCGAVVCEPVYFAHKDPHGHEKVQGRQVLQQWREQFVTRYLAEEARA